MSLLLTLKNITPCSDVSIVNFEHLIANWDQNGYSVEYQRRSSMMELSCKNIATKCLIGIQQHRTADELVDVSFKGVI